MNWVKNKISVVIVTYNQEKFIADTLQSVLIQDVEDLEIIVADDGSSDNTSEIIYALQKKASNIKYVRSPINKGISSNFNNAFKEVTGEFIAIMGGDDLMIPGKLKKQLNALMNNPKAVLCYHDAEAFESSTNQQLYLFSQKYSVPTNISENLFFTNWFLKKKECKLCGSSTFARSAYYLQTYFDTKLFYLNEMLHGMENYAKQPHGEMIYINEVLCRYRIHDNNVTRKSRPYADSFEEYRVMCDTICDNYPNLKAKAKNYFNFYLFKSLLFNYIPANEKTYYKKIFFKEAGILKYCYYKFCSFYLKIRNYGK